MVDLLKKPATRPGLVVLLTGLSGSGKTTTAHSCCNLLNAAGRRAVVLDGAVARREIGPELGFTAEDRRETLRRVGFVAKMLRDEGVTVFVAAIAPSREGRRRLREAVGGMVEIYLNAPLSVCERRDTDGIYGRARTGQINLVAGLDFPYEPPAAPNCELRVDTDTPSACVEKVLRVIGSSAHAPMDALHAHVEEAFYRLAEGHLTLADLAGSREPGVRRRISAALRASAGATFREIRRERLAAAARALLIQGKSVKGVAWELGFSSSAAFVRFFKTATGITPGSISRKR